MNSDQKRAFLAVTLSGLILFGWQYFFAPKQTAPVANTAQVGQPVNTNNSNHSNVNSLSGQNKAVETVIENDENSPIVGKFTISSNGLSITMNNYFQILDMTNEQAEKKFFDVVGPNKFDLHFSSMNGYKRVFFTVKQEDNLLTFTNEAEGLEIFAKIADNRVKFNVKSQNQRKFTFNLQTEEKEKHSAHVRNYVVLGEGLETNSVGSDDNGDEKVQWFGIDFEYHLFAVVFPNKINTIYRATEDKKLNIMPTTELNNFEFSVVFVKKEYDYLNKLGSNLHLAVDFGIFSILAVPILRGLQWIYDFIPNYGIAIILLTLLLRMITFPLQYKSFKSMKKMQDIQPELTKLKAKFKDDPQRMQKESMELFKRAGANPLGGCLPLLLQMPFFFAFYKVLYGAVELVDAPFLFWIQDLSSKDQFYVLPVLMAGAMFLQQKMSPTTVSDPAQKKVMMFMPIIFGLIMKDLPSGLCLYIFISTIFGVLQQMFVYKRTT
jgi:YidC/Oxa1 family membrane protein insertase